MSKRTDPQKKYWWLILVVVPIVVAVIGLVAAIVPLFFKSTPTRLPEGITITNNKFAGDMYFVTQVVAAGDASKAANAQQSIQAATSLVQGKNYTGAIAMLEQAAAQYQLPSIYNNLGVLYANSGDYTKAEQAYQSALRLDQNDQAANFNLGLLKQTQGKSDEAATLLAKAPALTAKKTPTAGSPTNSSKGTTLPIRVSTQTPGVSAELFEFTRNQNTITVKVRLINSSNKNTLIGYPTRDTHLLDEATHKQYPIFDQSNSGDVTVPANGSIEVWGKYTVPPEDKFQSLSVSLGNGILFERVTVP